MDSWHDIIHRNRYFTMSFNTTKQEILSMQFSYM